MTLRNVPNMHMGRPHRQTPPSRLAPTHRSLLLTITLRAATAALMNCALYSSMYTSGNRKPFGQHRNTWPSEICIFERKISRGQRERDHLRQSHTPHTRIKQETRTGAIGPARSRRLSRTRNYEAHNCTTGSTCVTQCSNFALVH